MNNTIDYLLACLRLLVCGQQVKFPELSEEQWKAIYEISCRQDLAHLVALAIEKNGSALKIPEALVKKFKQQKNMAVYRYTNQEYALAEIGDVFSEQGIYFLPLKGSVLRYYYPEAWMRTSGDIDVLIHEEDFERAKDLLMEKCRFSYESKDKKDASFYRDECVHLELHLNLVKKDDIERLCPEYIWKFVQKEGFRCRMRDEDFYAFHVEHMKNHFTTGGCGIRFFLDLWVLKHRMEYDVEKRRKAMIDCGLSEFERAAGKLADVWFSGAAHTKLTKSMESYILSAGVYGNIENWALVQEVQNESKWKSVWRRLWLPYEQLCWSYPALEGKRWLQPYYEWKRFAKMITDGRWHRSVTELKANTKMSKKQKDNMKRMLEELGL